MKVFCFRIVAYLFDLIFGLVFGYYLHWQVGHYFATRAVVTFHIGSPDTLWKGLIPWFLGLIGTYFYSLPLALFLIFIPEAIWGRSPGKLLLRLKIVDRNNLRSTQKKLGVRFILKTTIFWGTTLALCLGSWQFIIISITSGVIILLAGLHDQWAGTTCKIE